MKEPFLATLTATVAIPLALVLAVKVLPFTLIVTFLLASNLLPDFKVTLTFLTLLTFKVAFAVVKVVADLVTLIVAVSREDEVVASPA